MHCANETGPADAARHSTTFKPFKISAVAGACGPRNPFIRAAPAVLAAALSAPRPPDLQTPPGRSPIRGPTGLQEGPLSIYGVMGRARGRRPRRRLCRFNLTLIARQARGAAPSCPGFGREDRTFGGLERFCVVMGTDGGKEGKVRGVRLGC